MGQLQSFLLSDVAKIVKMPESTVKNWTIGRPLEITPSIMKDRGPGSRNVYSIEDLHLMALARQLCRDGFTTQTAQQVIEHMRPKMANIRHGALLISSNEHRLAIRVVESKDRRVPEVKDAIGYYLLHFDDLFKWVHLGIEKRSKEIEAKKKHKKGEN